MTGGQISSRFAAGGKPGKAGRPDEALAALLPNTAASERGEPIASAAAAAAAAAAAWQLASTGDEPRPVPCPDDGASEARVGPAGDFGLSIERLVESPGMTPTAGLKKAGAGAGAAGTMAGDAGVTAFAGGGVPSRSSGSQRLARLECALLRPKLLLQLHQAPLQQGDVCPTKVVLPLTLSALSGDTARMPLTSHLQQLPLL